MHNNAVVAYRVAQLLKFFLRCLLRAIALRLRFSIGVSKWRYFLISGKIPALETLRLKRRSADSIPINKSEVGQRPTFNIEALDF